MFQRKRQLKKNKSKSRTRLLIITLLFLTSIVLIAEYIYLNFSLRGVSLISPVANIKISQMADLENELEKKDILFSSINVNQDGSFNVNLAGGGVVILSSKKDIRAQLSSLQLILSRLTIEGKKLKSLDLRFESPVISF